MHSNQLLGPSLLLRAWTRPERKVCAASVVLLSLAQVSMRVPAENASEQESAVRQAIQLYCLNVVTLCLEAHAVQSSCCFCCLVSS